MLTKNCKANAVLTSFAATLVLISCSSAEEPLVPSLSGGDNNRINPDQGAANTRYRRVAPANYADDFGTPISTPNARYISNRIFADSAQNLFSENGVTQWAYNWGQFIDHSIGLLAEGDEALNTAFNPSDPLESFSSEMNALRASRSAAANDSGDDTVREQINTVSSYIDAWAVYGGSESR